MAEKPLTVLSIAPRFEVRGSSANTLRLAEGLQTHGIHSRIVTPNADLVAPVRRERLDISVHSRLNLPIWGRIVRESIVRALAAAPPDLVHIQSWSVYRTGAWLAQHLRRPFVLSVNEHITAKSRHRVNLEWGRRVIAVSQSVKAELLSHLALPPEMVSVIHAGVEVSPPIPASAVLAPGRLPVVGTAGPLEAVKGHVFFLGAAKRVLAVYPDLEFLVAGAGPEEENLRRVARELGINRNVTFFSNLYDFSGPLAAMDIFCLPSLRQGLGTVMLEAMAPRPARNCQRGRRHLQCDQKQPDRTGRASLRQREAGATNPGTAARSGAARERSEKPAAGSFAKSSVSSGWSLKRPKFIAMCWPLGAQIQ